MNLPSEYDLRGKSTVHCKNCDNYVTNRGYFCCICGSQFKEKEGVKEMTLKEYKDSKEKIQSYEDLDREISDLNYIINNLKEDEVTHVVAKKDMKFFPKRLGKEITEAIIKVCEQEKQRLFEERDKL